MTLIKSISGIRGTIGGTIGDNLTPLDLVKFVTSYAQFLKKESKGKRLKVVVGRDARMSGDMAARIVTGTLMGCGIDVADIGLASTPTTELAVSGMKADGGIILTASHNPKQWNALKLLDHKGEFLNDKAGKEILKAAEDENFNYCEVEALGKVETFSYDKQHIDSVLNLRLVEPETVRAKRLKAVVDGINSVGGTIIPQLLERMGVEVIKLNCEPNGNFAHNPEPLKEHLTDICRIVKEEKADLGIVVDPDVDRLAFITEEGEMFGEEYTLVSVADYILSKTAGNTVSNLSSTRALAEVTKRHGGTYTAAAVGEVNVVAAMKETNAIIGGEGNGGIIYPESHYGRDALVGVALMLTNLSKSGKTLSQLRKSYPQFYMSKNKIELTPVINVDALLVKIKELYRSERVTDIDGVKIDFANEWVHLRKSNTEPIIRIYTESTSQDAAETLAKKMIEQIKGIL